MTKLLTLEDRWVVEGLTEKADLFRHYIEAEYDLDFIEADNLRAELEREANSIKDQMEILRKKINSNLFSKKEKAPLQEEHRELFWSLYYTRERLDFAEERVNRHLSPLSLDTEPKSQDFQEQWDDEDEEDEGNDPDAYTSMFHWMCAHDVAQKRQDDLEHFLKRSSEKQDRRVLLRIDHLRKRQELSAWWYYRLSVMVVKKHVTKKDYNQFAAMNHNEKKKARRLQKWFWAATANRLVNFRTKCEETARNNDRTWGPKDPDPLENLHMSFDDRWDYGRSLTEDQLISILDTGKE